MAKGIIAREKIDVEKLVKRHARRQAVTPVFNPPTLVNNDKRDNRLKSLFIDPLSIELNYHHGLQTISPHHGRQITYRILRRVAEKAWIINLCISTAISQARPFFKEATDENQRGFNVKSRKAKETGRDMNETEKKQARALVDFFMNTGDVDDPARIDDLDKYATKIIRDLYQLDQISCELQRTRGGELCAFWAIDTATIEMALPDSELENGGVKYAQIINGIPYAFYGKDDLIFDCMNPRTDIERAGYGYSLVEQAIDLVTSSINTFMYNAGYFTENRLPRGVLLLNGPADQGEIEDIEDYISNLMSGQPTSQWRVPIIPTGRTKDAASGGKIFEWVNLQGTSKEMEFQAWFDLQLSAITSLFKKSLEELGLHSSKSQPTLGRNDDFKIQASKSLGLGDLLTFLQKHFNQILQYKNPDYIFEFTGYEKDSPKIITEIDKSEIETWKTLNEKRIEKGAQPIDFSKVENPADLPMNGQVVQIWQTQKAQSGMGGGLEDSGDFDDECFEEDFDEGGETADDEAWGEIEEGGEVNKSLGAAQAVRVVV